MCVFCMGLSMRWFLMNFVLGWYLCCVIVSEVLFFLVSGSNMSLFIVLFCLCLSIIGIIF